MNATAKRSTRWSAAVMRIYQKFPAAFKSTHWDEIVRLANTGQVKAAEFLASDHQDRKKSHRAQNVIARRLRLQRVALFQLQRAHLAKITEAFKAAAATLSTRMARLPSAVSSIAPMRERTHLVIVELRRTLQKITTDLVWQSILLGVRNMGEALKPILRDNRESFAEELSDVVLLEDRLTMGMDRQFAGRTRATVDLNSDKWEKIMDRLYQDIVRSNNNGLSLSERIWDLTARAEQDIRRILATDIAMGRSSRAIADRLQQYILTQGIDDAFQSGPGIYRSPLRNALRVARTETNRAYTKASAAWAENKPWVKGIRVTLSPAHEVEDDCDDIAGNEYSPDEFADVIPVHPHCMCFGVYVIDEDYLTGTAPSDEEEEG